MYYLASNNNNNTNNIIIMVIVHYETWIDTNYWMYVNSLHFKSTFSLQFLTQTKNCLYIYFFIGMVKNVGFKK